MTKEKFRQEATFDEEESSFILSLYSKLFSEQVTLLVTPELEEKEQVSDRIIDIINDLYNLDPSNLEVVKNTVWKAFNRYGELRSYTLYEDDDRFKKNEITKEEYALINKNRQQELFEIYSKEDCWDQIGEPQFQTCLWPDHWKHRFGLLVFYPEWEENGLSILVRNGEIFGYANGLDPIIPEFDNPEVSSVYELWS